MEADCFFAFSFFGHIKAHHHKSPATTQLPPSFTATPLNFVEYLLLEMFQY